MLLVYGLVSTALLRVSEIESTAIVGSDVGDLLSSVLRPSHIYPDRDGSQSNLEASSPLQL